MSFAKHFLNFTVDTYELIEKYHVSLRKLLQQEFLILNFMNKFEIYKESLPLSTGISLKVICEKVKFSNYDFCNNLMIMNSHTCKLFSNILNDVQIECNGEIITV